MSKFNEYCLHIYYSLSTYFNTFHNLMFNGSMRAIRKEDIDCNLSIIKNNLFGLEYDASDNTIFLDLFYDYDILECIYYC
ncbi:hypothetical protein LBMAG35_13640 [Chlorobiota bacterium]|nr:hypothetical protein LBMAG35_13640 [Chlorobiota bacterium]